MSGPASGATPTQPACSPTSASPHAWPCGSEFLLRLRLHLLPGTVDTQELGELFSQLFPDEADEQWLLAIDDTLLERLARLLFMREDAAPWREAMLNGLTVLVSAVHAAGLSGPLRQRMGSELLAMQAFEQLPRAAEQFSAALRAGDHEALRRARNTCVPCWTAAARPP